MRVLMVTTSFPRSRLDPAGSFIGLLAHGLADRGLAVDIVAPGAPQDSDGDGSAGSGVSVHWTSDTTTLTGGGGGVVAAIQRRPWRVWNVPGLLCRMQRQADRLAKQADIIHGHWCYPGGMIAVRAARSTRRPVLVTAHGTDIALARRWGTLAFAVRWTAKRATRMAAVSEGLRDDMGTLGLRRTEIALLRMGVRRPRTSARTARQEGEFTVVFVGSLTINKQVDVLVRAFAQVCQPKWRLMIVGDGPERQRLEQLSSGIGISSVVSFTGRVDPDHVEATLQMSDVLVLPSRTEGFGLVLAEAAQSGVAIVATDIPGPRDLVVEGESGLLVKPGSVEALAGALARLGADSAVREKLATGAQAAFDRLGLSIDTSVSRHIAVYEELIGSRTAGGSG